MCGNLACVGQFKSEHDIPYITGFVCVGHFESNFAMRNQVGLDGSFRTTNLYV